MIIWLYFTLNLVVKTYSVSEVCNPIECFTGLSKIFQYDETEDSCMKLSKIERCIQLCFSGSTSDLLLLEGLRNVQFDVCKDYPVAQVQSRCIDKHKYLLMSCVYENFNLISVNSTNEKLLMCRKIRDAQNCDRNIFPCSLHSEYIAEKLMGRLFQPMYAQYCEFETADIYNLKVAYPVFAEGYKNLASCLDLRGHLVDTCVPSEWSSRNAVIHSYSSKLCNAVETFVDCIADIIQKNCPRSMDVFDSISGTLKRSMLPKCFVLKSSRSNKVNFNTTHNQEKPQDVGSDITVDHHVEILVKENHSSNILLTNVNIFLSISLSVAFCFTRWFIFMQ